MKTSSLSLIYVVFIVGYAVCWIRVIKILSNSRYKRPDSDWSYHPKFVEIVLTGILGLIFLLGTVLLSNITK